jgi:hypothetical protein
MYIVTTEVAPHVRVSKTLDKVAHFSREPRARKTERRQLNRFAARNAVRFDPTPRLVKPDTGLKVVSLADFKASRPVSEKEAVLLVPATVASFDKREAVAQEAGL